MNDRLYCNHSINQSLDCQEYIDFIYILKDYLSNRGVFSDSINRVYLVPKKFIFEY